MQSLPLQRGIIYGPVRSRRLGRSLGVNLLSTDRKVCPFDCMYCQYGPTQSPTLRPAGVKFPTVAQVADSLEQALAQAGEVESITFSGNGEPTIYPQFGDVVDAARAVRDRLCPQARLAVLSNSALAVRPEVRDALNRLDVRIMKLDAGTDGMLRSVNRPVHPLTVQAIVANLKLLNPVVLQTVMVDGPVVNCRGPELESWFEAVAEVRPIEVQVYGISRPPAEEAVLPVPAEVLRSIVGEVMGRLGVKASAY